MGVLHSLFLSKFGSRDKNSENSLDSAKNDNIRDDPNANGISGEEFDCPWGVEETSTPTGKNSHPPSRAKKIKNYMSSKYKKFKNKKKSKRSINKYSKINNCNIEESEIEWNEAIAKKKEIGIHIWRVHNKIEKGLSIFGIESVPKNNYGIFFNGDCYIILNKYKNNNDRMLYNAHFWLGSESTIDEWGVAAYKTVELDDRFNGCIVQFREVQGNESKKFMKIFDDVKLSQFRFVVKQGGYKSGLQRVNRDSTNSLHRQQPRLLQIMGDQLSNVEAIPVKFDKLSLNNTDSFILYTGNDNSNRNNNPTCE